MRTQLDKLLYDGDELSVTLGSSTKSTKPQGFNAPEGSASLRHCFTGPNTFRMLSNKSSGQPAGMLEIKADEYNGEAVDDMESMKSRGVSVISPWL